MATLSTNPDYVYDDMPEFRTLITEFENGVEQRRSKWATPLRKFRLFYKNRSTTDFETVRDFFVARLGAYDSFTWNNPNDSADYTVRFVKDSLRFKNVHYGIYNFDFELQEVR